MWIKIDDGLADHPKIERAGPAAAWLYVCGLCYAGRYLTDGHIPRERVPRLAAVADPERLADRLVEVGLWIEVEDGYEIHGFLDYNPPRESVEEEREAAKDRMNKLRAERRAKRSGNVRPNNPRTSPEVREMFARSSPSPSRPVPSIETTPPVVPHGGPSPLLPVPDDAEEQDASGPLAQLAEIRAASKRGKAKKGPTPEAARVLARMAELSGCRYEGSSALEARLREGVSVDDLLAVVEHLGRDPWWRDKRYCNADAPFRRDKFAGYLAQARAQPSLPLNDAPTKPKGVSDEDWRRLNETYGGGW